MPGLPATYASGVRVDLAAAPQRVLAVVAELLGEPIAAIEPATGGMAPGAAAVVRGPSGRAIFVKAVGSRTNAMNVELYRREAVWGTRLPDLAAIVRPLGSRDLSIGDASEGSDGEEDWVVTGFPAIEGQPPRHPWQLDVLTRVLDAWLPVAEAFTPSPFAEVSHDTLAGFFTGWQQIADAPDDPWHELSEQWVERDRRFIEAIRAGNTFTHSDLRADNIMIGRDGTVHFVDWVHASLGARWVDPAILLGDVVASWGDAAHELDLSTICSHPAFDGATTEQLEDSLGAYAAATHVLSRHPPSPSLPTIRGWQRVQSEAVLRYLQRD